MRIEELKPSRQVQGRWLAVLEDGSILRLGEGEVVDFALYAGKELSEGEAEALTQAARRSGLRQKALNLLTSKPMSRRELEQKLRSNKFTLSDFYDQLTQLKGMGSLQDIAGMVPGMNAGALKGAQVDEKAMARTEAIIQSMTPFERENPSVLNHSRKRRIAAGAGVRVEQINQLLKQFDMMNQMVKQFSGPGASKKMKRMGKMGGFPGGMGGFPGM